MRAAARLLEPLRPILEAALDVLLPPGCLSCGKVAGHGGQLCVACWTALDFVTAPHCARCGFPFEIDLGANSLCLACLRRPPAFDRARSLLRYDDKSKGTTLRFKHADRTEGTKAFAAWLRRSGRRFWPTPI